MPALDLSIIIVNWNAISVIPGCIDSILGNLKNLRFEIIVVDNASSDDSPAIIAERFKQVILIKNTENKGFAKGCNQAGDLAKGQFLLFLNPDTISYPGSIERMVDFLIKNPETGCVGPRIINPDGSYQRSCWKGYPGLKMALADALYLWKLPPLFNIKNIEFTQQDLQQVVEVDHLLGACLLVRRETWEQVGGLDESFFLFLEETDWCYRAKIKGWNLKYFPYSQITHIGEHSVNQNPQRNIPQFYKSYCQFYRKNQSTDSIKLGILKVIIFMGSLLRIGLWTVRAIRSKKISYSHARSMQKGYIQVLRVISSY